MIVSVLQLCRKPSLAINSPIVCLTLQLLTVTLSQFSYKKVTKNKIQLIESSYILNCTVDLVMPEMPIWWKIHYENFMHVGIKSETSDKDKKN